MVITGSRAPQLTHQTPQGSFQTCIITCPLRKLRRVNSPSAFPPRRWRKRTICLHSALQRKGLRVSVVLEQKRRVTAAQFRFIFQAFDFPSSVWKGGERRTFSDLIWLVIDNRQGVKWCSRRTWSQEKRVKFFICWDWWRGFYMQSTPHFICWATRLLLPAIDPDAGHDGTTAACLAPHQKASAGWRTNALQRNSILWKAPHLLPSVSYGRSIGTPWSLNRRQTI